MTDENPIDRLLAISDVLRLTLGLDDDAAWLHDATMAVIDHEKALGDALGITGMKGRHATPRAKYLRRERNEHLRAALWHCEGDYSTLEREIDLFDTRLKSRWQVRAEPDPLWSDARKQIHAAYRVGIGMPKTIAGLRLAINN